MILLVLVLTVTIENFISMILVPLTDSARRGITITITITAIVATVIDTSTITLSNECNSLVANTTTITTFSTTTTTVF